jgi:hypothetical protein
VTRSKVMSVTRSKVMSVTRSKVMSAPVSGRQTDTLDGLFGSPLLRTCTVNYLSVPGVKSESTGLETSRDRKRLRD